MDNRRTAASIRRSYTGARSRAEGAGFESIIDNACAYYRSIGLADIEKHRSRCARLEARTVLAGSLPATRNRPSRTTKAFSKAEEPSILKQSTLTVTG